MNKVIQLNDNAKTIIDTKFLSAIKMPIQYEEFPPLIWIYCYSFVVVVGFEKWQCEYITNDVGNKKELAESKKIYEQFRSDYETLKQILLKKYE